MTSDIYSDNRKFRKKPNGQYELIEAHVVKDEKVLSFKKTEFNVWKLAGSEEPWITFGIKVSLSEGQQWRTSSVSPYFDLSPDEWALIIEKIKNPDTL